MFNYVSLGTNDLERAAHFYDAVLDPLGLRRCDTSAEPNWEVNAPGHFDGATMLHWPGGADGRGALLSGDIFQVVPSKTLSFMRSYPNLIPLPARTVKRMDALVQPFAYDRIYGAWWDRVIETDAKETVARSVARYLKWIGG